jgi:signal transduction histidine kinase
MRYDEEQSVVQSHVDITQWAPSGSAALTASSLAAQLRHLAQLIHAPVMAILRWDAASGYADCRASFPNPPLELLSNDLTWLVDILRAEAIAHADRRVHALPHGQLLTDHPPQTVLLSLGRSPSNFFYGGIVREQVGTVDVLVLGCDQALTTEQVDVLELWIDILNDAAEMEQQMQRQQAKIALLEQVIQHTAHQARQPLSLIELYTDVMLRSPMDDAVRSQLDSVRSATTDLERHIYALSNYSQHPSLNLELHALADIWVDSLEQVRPWIRQKNIQINAPSGSVNLMCDRWQITQVFKNLLHNAIHFSPEGGAITCQWQRFQEEVLIDLSDEGPGIDEADLPKIFHPSHSRREGGTGIGLAVVKKIVLDHQGLCWATNRPGGGAQVSFTLKC